LPASHNALNEPKGVNMGLWGQDLSRNAGRRFHKEFFSEKMWYGKEKVNE